jgi:hypothetical protein
MRDTIDMAREAGIKLAWVATITGSNKMKVLLDFDQLKAFEALVRADEREACAKVCDSFQARNVGMQPAECAGAIRNRGNT